MEDIGIFIILHFPFMVYYGCFTFYKVKFGFKLAVLSIVVVTYCITIIAYFNDLGDDFAIIQYWSLYAITPVIYAVRRVLDNITGWQFFKSLCLGYVVALVAFIISMVIMFNVYPPDVSK